MDGHQVTPADTQKTHRELVGFGQRVGLGGPLVRPIPKIAPAVSMSVVTPRCRTASIVHTWSCARLGFCPSLVVVAIVRTS